MTKSNQTVEKNQQLQTKPAELSTKNKFYYQSRINLSNYKNMFENVSSSRFDLNKLKSVIGKCINKTYTKDDALLLVKILNLIETNKRKKVGMFQLRKILPKIKYNFNQNQPSNRKESQLSILPPISIEELKSLTRAKLVV